MANVRKVWVTQSKTTHIASTVHKIQIAIQEKQISHKYRKQFPESCGVTWCQHQPCSDCYLQTHMCCILGNRQFFT